MGSSTQKMVRPWPEALIVETHVGAVGRDWIKHNSERELKDYSRWMSLLNVPRVYIQNQLYEHSMKAKFIEVLKCIHYTFQVTNVKYSLNEITDLKVPINSFTNIRKLSEFHCRFTWWVWYYAGRWTSEENAGVKCSSFLVC